MMQTSLCLHLKRQQAEQLAAYCPVCRAYLWRAVPPSVDRNQILRAIQAFHARLLCAQEHTDTAITLSLTFEEGKALRQMFPILLELYGMEQPSEQRTHALRELATLRVAVEQSLRWIPQ